MATPSFQFSRGGTTFKMHLDSDHFYPCPLLTLWSKLLTSLIRIITLISYLISCFLPSVYIFKYQIDQVTTLLKLFNGFSTQSKIKVNSSRDILQLLVGLVFYSPLAHCARYKPTYALLFPLSLCPGIYKVHSPVCFDSNVLFLLRLSLKTSHKIVVPLLSSNLYPPSLRHSFTAHITTWNILYFINVAVYCLSLSYPNSNVRSSKTKVFVYIILHYIPRL